MKNKIIFYFIINLLLSCEDAEFSNKEYPYIITKSANVLGDGTVFLEAEIMNYQNIGKVDEYGFEIIGPGSKTEIMVGQDLSIHKFNYELRTGLEKNTNYVARAYSIHKGIKVFGSTISFESIGSTAIKITSPRNFSSLPINEIVTFEITLFSDVLESFNHLNIELISDKDGELGQGIPDNNGNIKFNIQILSPQVHNIRAVLSDSKGFIAMHAIQVVTTISLTKLEFIEGNVVLEWTEIINSNFNNYEIVRLPEDGKEKVIASIFQSEITSFTDKLPPIAQSIEYFIRLNINEGKRKPIDSNKRRITLPDYLFDFQPNTLLLHPAKDYIYLLNSDYASSTLVQFDYFNNSVNKQITTNQFIGYCDIGTNGSGLEIYLPGKSSIMIYDASSLEYKEEISTGLRASCVVSSNSGFLIASVKLDPYGRWPVRTYSRQSRLFISASGIFSEDRIRMVPNKLQALSITSQVSPSTMFYISFSESGNILSHLEDKLHGNILDHSIFKISNSGEYVITARHGAIYGTNTDMRYIGKLAGNEFNDFCFSDNGKTIFAAHGQQISIFEYPSLIKVKEIKTRGIPILMERKNNKIIAISQSTVNPDIYAVELLDLK